MFLHAFAVSHLALSLWAVPLDSPPLRQTLWKNTVVHLFIFNHKEVEGRARVSMHEHSTRLTHIDIESSKDDSIL